MRKKRKLLIISTVIVNLIYLLWRVHFSMPTEASRISMVLAWGLLFAELLGVFELFVYLHGASHGKVPVLPVISEDLYPEVDVFIATYNEPVALLRKTIIGCKNMEYPKENHVHIYLCDDGNRLEVRNLAEELEIHYLGRAENKGAKAGNLNHAMSHSKSPLIATFDADMIPMSNFLLETVPYFLTEEEKIGFVQTPQAFYNADLFQTNLYSENRIPNEQDYFYRNVQVTKNATNTVIYGGSNTVIARAALEAVGGFFEKSITEDFATGILIQSKGYQCYATNKPLASGLAPNDLKSLIMQRERWARGCIQTIRRLNIFFRKGLNWKQKISYASAIAYWYAPVKRFFYIVAPIAFTVFGIRVIHASFEEVMLFFLPAYLLTLVTVQILCDDIRNCRWTNIYETITFSSLMKSVLYETIGISKSKFSVTSKSAQAECDKKYHYKKAIPLCVYIFLSVVGITNIFIYMPRYTTLNFVVLLFWLITNMLYLIMALLFMLEFHKPNTKTYYNESIAFDLYNNSKKYEAVTTEISDTYIRFEMNESLETDVQGPIFAVFRDTREGYLSMNEIRIPVARMVRLGIRQVGQKSQGNVYELEINSAHSTDYDRWLGYLYNRMPTMPVTISGSKHIWDDLKTNIQARIARES